MTILAILLAIAVPSVLNYLDEADNAKCIAEAKSILTGSKKYLTHQYASKRLENLSFSGYLTNDEKTDIVNGVKGNGTLMSLYYKEGVIQTFAYYVHEKYVVFLGYNKQFVIKDTVYENMAEAVMLDTKIRALMDQYMSDRKYNVGLRIDSEAGEGNMSISGVGNEINNSLENLGFDLSNTSWQIEILNPNTSGDKPGITRYQFLISDVKITSEMEGDTVNAMKYIYYGDNTKDENKFGNEDNYGAQVKCVVEMHT